MTRFVAREEGGRVSVTRPYLEWETPSVCNFFGNDLSMYVRLSKGVPRLLRALDSLTLSPSPFIRPDISP